ncbi:MAG: aldose 1-epimerase [Pseudomonadota bacterium]|nr:aldose 1-epimerase [Pseudomonadota bacterium]
MQTCLETPFQRLLVDPALGGSVLRWDWRMPDGHWEPLFRPASAGASAPTELACFPLAPWANRVSAGGFDVAGRHHALGLNWPGDACPLHGDAWLQAWSLQSAAVDTLTMVLDSARPQHSPYRFQASQRFDLLADGLVITLQLRAQDALPLPYGIGLHPYFHDVDDAVLQAACDGVWLPEAGRLAARHVQPVPAPWSFAHPRATRELLVDHCFSGWDGKAVIAWPRRGLTLRMTASPASGWMQLCRQAGWEWLCLEPVSHPVDAFHLPGMPGLAVLAPGETLSLAMDLRVA